jgi:hypothetical protein
MKRTGGHLDLRVIEADDPDPLDRVPGSRGTPGAAVNRIRRRHIRMQHTERREHGQNAGLRALRAV